MSIALVMLIVFFSFPLLYAQTNTDSLQAAKLLNTAKKLATKEQYQESNNQALKGISQFEHLRDWKNCLSGYQLIFYNGLYSQDYSSAISIIKKGKNSIPKDRLDILAKMDYLLGYSYNELGEIFSSIEAYETSASSFLIGEDTTWLISTYGNLGIGYTQTGEYSKAIDYLNIANSLNQNPIDTTVLLNNLWNLGEAYSSKGDWENALKSYNRAQRLNPLNDGTFEFFIAEIQLEQKKFNAALRSIQKAINLSIKEYGDVYENISPYEKLLGEIYLRSDQHKLALSSFQKILPYFEKNPNKRELGKLYILISETQSALKQYDKALKTYQIALKTLLPGFKNEKPLSNPDESLWNRELWLMEIFKGKGDCFFEKYQLDNNNQWLYSAEENYQLAIDFIQKVKLNYEETESKLSIGDYTHPFYEDLIKVKLKRFHISGDIKYKEEIFQTAQTANAFVLRAMLNEQEALKIAGVSKDQVNLMKNIQQQITLINRKLEGHLESDLDSLSILLTKLKLKQQKVKKSIEENYPEFFRLRNDLKVATSRQLQQKSDDSSLFIKYFLGKKNLYAISISRSDFEIDTISLPLNFDTLIFKFRRAISDLDFITSSPDVAEQEYLKSAHQLYKILLQKPLQRQSKNQQIQRLIIAADGVLNSIPFQALLLRKSESWTNPDHFVISEYAVSYTYFSKMLLDAHEIKYGRNGFTSFGLEFDDYTLEYLKKISKDSVKNMVILDNIRSGTFSKLPFSDDEAMELAKLMNGRSWLNEEATKLNFLKYAISASIIHVATHSVLDTNKPNQSSLIFIKKKDTLDNLLRQEEIYNLNSNADMIVLSACNTAYGQNQKSEGLNSLARAFSFAGIPSVTATLWNISDETSRKLMLLYYQFLKEGKTKDVALQKAQLEFLKNDHISSPVFRLPVYWAAWMPVGDNREIYVEKTSNHFYSLLFLIATLLLFWLIYKRKIS